MSDESGPSNLFRSLIGKNLTEEQWESYKQMKVVESGLVCSDSSDEECEEVDDSRSSSPFGHSRSSSPFTTLLPSNETHVSQTKQTQQTESGGSDASEGEQDTMTSSPWESELTVKYIDGELSFSEFADIMEKRDDTPESKEEATTKQGEREIDKTLLEKVEKEYDDEVKKHRKRGRRETRLPRYLQGLMGEANLCFARGDHEDAIKMCMEIIRSAPTAHEPFQTLGILYEELGDMEKAFQFSLIGAYLHPNDAEEWIKLAEMALEQGNVKQAINCYSNAIRCDPTNISLLWERCNLYEQQGDRKRALGGYEAIMQQLKPEQGEQCVQLSREIAKIHHESGDIPAAIQVMEVAFSKFPGLITSEDVNVLLELQISQKRYKDAVRSLCEHCGVSLLFSEEETVVNAQNISEEGGFDKINICKVPEVLPIDLQAKLCNSLIHLKAFHLVKPLLRPLQQENPDDVGDLYLDIAEAYMDVGDHVKAIPFLNALLSTKNYNLAAVWLRYSECLNATGNIEQATTAYKRVVEMAPSHLGARLSLSSLLQQMGKTQEAVSALKQDYEKGKEDAVIDLHLLFQRCTLLYNQGLWDEFIKAAKLVHGSHCYPLTTSVEYATALNNQSAKRRKEALKEIQKEPGSQPGPKYTNKNVSPDDMWDLYLKICHKLFEVKRLHELQAVALQALTSTMFSKNPQRVKEIEFFALLSCYFNRHHDYAYILVKDLVFREVQNIRAWNLFCQVITMGQDIRHNKFCLRLMMKYQDHIPLGYMNGHSAMVAGSYKHALGEYMCVFKEQPNNPFTVFCIALTFVHMASQKFASKRHSLVVQGTVFLNQYLDLRGECQESLYNIGRAMHQLGLCDQALYYYKKALNQKPAIENDDGYFDLRHEIVYNLSLIYQNSGSPHLAKFYLEKYCIV